TSAARSSLGNPNPSRSSSGDTAAYTIRPMRYLVLSLARCSLVRGSAIAMRRTSSPSAISGHYIAGVTFGHRRRTHSRYRAAQASGTRLLSGISGKGACLLARDESCVGQVGVLTVATRGGSGPGEVRIKVRGGSETFIAW